MKPDYSYELRFASLALGMHELDFKVDSSLLIDQGVHDFDDADCTVVVHVEKQERFLKLYFEIDGWLNTICDRCGEELNVELSTENELVVRFAAKSDFTDDEVIFLDENETSLDLAQFIYEYIMVGLPTRRIHPQGACDPDVLKYLEENSEKENIKDEKNELDPRWEALKKLKN